jgi:putative N6-adenine-specific DNA methylase
MKELLATTLFGLENTLANELVSIGADNVRVRNRAVSFSGDKAMMYRANYHLRTALRILRPLKSFPAGNEDDLYRNVRGMNWEQHIDTHDLIAVETVLLSKQYRHSGFISQRVKDGIVDRIRDKTGKRPSVDVKTPDVKINIHITDKECTVSLDSSGDSLHRRGYRTRPYMAPLNEVLAAGMVLLSGWEPGQAFLNPMCGSGTLCIEAGLIAKGFPGGYYRHEFGFQKWGDFDARMFESVRRERYLKENARFSIHASDISFDAVRSAQQNLAGAGLLDRISLKKAAFSEWDTGERGGVIILNPPYGERLEESNLVELYRDIGNTLKNRYPGFKAWVLSGNPEVIKHVGLKPGRKITLFNGPIRCKYHSFDLYEGSKKIVNKTEDNE